MNHVTSAISEVLNAKPRYTAAYITHPMAISFLLPNRSDAVPPTTDEIVLTTWSAAHINGMNLGPPAASVKRRSRNASVELPSVKIDNTMRYRFSEDGSAVIGNSDAVSAVLGSGCCGSFAKRSSSTVSAPGIAVRANNVRYRLGYATTKAV